MLTAVELELLDDYIENAEKRAGALSSAGARHLVGTTRAERTHLVGTGPFSDLFLNP
jgi:hypothetical protein